MCIIITDLFLFVCHVINIIIALKLPIYEIITIHYT